MSRFREYLEYGCAAAFCRVCRIFPERCIRALARCLAFLVYAVVPWRRRTALANCRAAFPDLSSVESRKLVRAAYRHAGDVVAESLLLLEGRLDRESILARVDMTEVEKFRTIEAESSQGILILTAHLGNWELMAAAVALTSRNRCCAVGRRTTNPLLEERIVKPLRTRFGNRVIYKRKAMLPLVKALRRGQNVGLLIDQKANRKTGVSVSFFGQEVRAVSSPAILQLRYGITAVPLFLVREASGRYTLKVGDPVPVPPEGEDVDARVRELTQRHQELIEAAIRDHPEQWLWMHDRWRRRR